MYYIVYGLLYIFSLLPFSILYLVSDFAYFILYYIIGYRKDVVMGNLAIAFPEKTPSDRKKIAKRFYKNFSDTFIETIKLLSLGDKEFDRRCKGDFSQVNAIAEKGGNILLLAAHQFNWEFVNLFMSRHIKIPFIGIVANVENKVFNRIYFKFRAKYGTILIPNSSFQRQMIEWLKKQYSMCLAADQATAPHKAFWVNLFGRPAPLIMGPHKTAWKNKPAVVYVNVQKIKRGFYELVITEIVTNPQDYTQQDFALKYRDFVQEIIRKQPDNYLWSHRRWKHTYNESYSAQWIDTVPPGQQETP
jgi:KDO2-lipid IV(A) lauroyltransferase